MNFGWNFLPFVLEIVQAVEAASSNKPGSVKKKEALDVARASLELVGLPVTNTLISPVTDETGKVTGYEGEIPELIDGVVGVFHNTGLFRKKQVKKPAAGKKPGKKK